MPDDIIADVMRLVREMDPQRPHDELWRLERRIRDVWGGQRAYVGKALAAGKAHRLAESLAAGCGLHEARVELGVCRSTLYRMLRRRWVRDY